jgi:hypothetical protein
MHIGAVGRNQWRPLQGTLTPPLSRREREGTGINKRRLLEESQTGNDIAKTFS